MKNHMKNPLRKRILREFKADLGKYLVIFLFMVLLIGLVSGFLVSNYSVKTAYDEGFTKYKLEYGHFSLDQEPEQSFFEDLEEKGNVTLYDLSYLEETYEAQSANIRIYKDRDAVDLECVMSGEMPDAEDEIALDRMFAVNASLEVGDTITLAGKELTISGFAALPDYSCLYENNSDMMFDSIHFGVAVMTEAGYEALDSSHETCNYAWTYNDASPEDDAAEKKLSDAFLESLKEVLTDYDTQIATEEMSTEHVVSLTDYLPRYNNQAINFTGDDMLSDKAGFLMFDYIVILILAFVFAVTISNTISQEAGAIGTLRASGYTRGELIRHYMVLPVAVTLIAAVVGNLLGYLVMKQFFTDMLYNSYSLCTYKTLWSAEAFIDTTLIPIVLMFVINLFVLIRKLQLSPLKFLRHELNRRQKKKLLHLNTRIPFIHRFRLRILLQNIPAYLTMFAGILLASVLCVFGLMFVPLLEDYGDLVVETEIAPYQYVMKEQVETSDDTAEKYSVTSLDSTYEGYMTDEVAIYGIWEDSTYITSEIPEDEVLISNGMSEKFGIEVGDTVTLKDHYSDDTYEFTVGGVYTYDAAMAVFMGREDFNATFDKDEDYFTGYFAKEELEDLDDDQVASVITEDDLKKTSDQLMVSMGSFMSLMSYFAVVMFLLMMYLLTKQIIEKNGQSISMVKILGFKNGEISGLYLVITSVVVVASLLISMPLCRSILKWAFNFFMYKEITGYIPFIVDPMSYVKTVVMGIGSYLVVCALMMRKIHKVPMSNALKTLE